MTGSYFRATVMIKSKYLGEPDDGDETKLVSKLNHVMVALFPFFLFKRMREFAL